jgi:hypothetical protein
MELTHHEAIGVERCMRDLSCRLGPTLRDLWQPWAFGHSKAFLAILGLALVQDNLG